MSDTSPSWSLSFLFWLKYIEYRILLPWICANMKIQCRMGVATLKSRLSLPHTDPMNTKIIMVSAVVPIKVMTVVARKTFLRR